MVALTASAVVAGVVPLMSAGSPARAADRSAVVTGTGGAKSAVTLAAAQEAAEASDANVEVTSLRSESGEVYATPDGPLEAVQHLKPVRTRVGGAWKAIDNTLAKRSDGGVMPDAAAVGLSFSGGGSDPLVTLEKAGRKLSFSWPTPLPAPTLEGDTATYANVLPDVDLKVRSVTDGFSELLVVKSAEAAKNPELAEVKLGVDSPGLDLQETASGGLEAVDQAAGGVVFQAAKPVMWDSAEASGTQTQMVQSAAAEENSSTVADAGDGPGA
ncbi:LamG domain-containing protein, partial [Streptomyces sp. NPDC058272]